MGRHGDGYLAPIWLGSRFASFALRWRREGRKLRMRHEMCGSVDSTRRPIRGIDMGVAGMRSERDGARDAIGRKFVARRLRRRQVLLIGVPR